MEITFKSDTKHRKTWFTGLHFSHPAKMHLSLQLWIINNYTKPGDIILDPMAGSGTIMVACSMGRNVICVELEQKFVRMECDNWEKVRICGAQLGYSMGEYYNLWGDARNILKAREHSYRELWRQYPKLDYPSIKTLRRHYNLPLASQARNLEGLLCDSIITSPPYCEAKEGGGLNKRENWMKHLKDIKRDPEAISQITWTENRKTSNPKDLGNLPYGNLDAVITSPSYGKNPGTPSLGSVNKDDWGKEGTDIVKRRGLEKGYSDNPDNLGNLSYGSIDSIITSPPYGLGEGLGHSEKQESKIRREKYAGWLYGETEGQIGNLKGGQDLLNDRRDYVIIDSRNLFKENSLCLENISAKIVGIQAIVDVAVSVTWRNPIKWFTLWREIERYLKSCEVDPSREELIAPFGEVEGLNGEEKIGSISILKLNNGIIGLAVYVEKQTEQKSLFIISSLGNLEGLQNCLISLPYAEVAMIKPTDLGKGNIWCSAKYAVKNTKVAVLYLEPVPLNVELGSILSNSIGGKLRKPTYISEIYKVYRNCYSVLKPGGIMVLVTKNFIRNKQEVRLDEDTIKLCQEAGFTFHEQHYRKLTSQSFWRVIYQQKYPDAPVLDKEDVLVFTKRE